MEERIRVLFLFLLILIMSINGAMISKAEGGGNVQEKNVSRNELKKEYAVLTNYIKVHNIGVDLSYDTFEEEYYNTNANNINEYIQLYYDLFTDSEEGSKFKSFPVINSSGAKKWYYNTGERLPRAANYSKYNLLKIVEPGDIIYEANGGLGVTGHIAIVEGVFYDEKYQQYYIRIIEAIDAGVCRSVLDDQRADEKDITIFKVKGASEEKTEKAIAFCKSQIGKEYYLDLKKNTSKKEKNWYCSELVWASYYRQDINIETTGKVNEPGITPRDIKRSAKTEEKSFIKIGTPEIKGITSNTASTVDIVWKKVPSVSGYKIYRSNGKEKYKCVGKTSKLTYQDKRLNKNKKYYYKVVAYKGGDESNDSKVAVVTTRLAAPVITKATANNKSSITLNWSSISGAKQYCVYRAEKSNGEYLYIASVKTRTYTDRNLASKKRYYYKVMAKTEKNITELSKWKSAMTK